MKAARLILIVLLQWSAMAYSQSVTTTLTSYVNRLHSTPSSRIPTDLLKEQNAAEVIRNAASFYTDTLPEVRAKIYYLVARAGTKSSEASVRQQAVEQLVKATTDQEVANIGILWTSLSQFKKVDFSPVATDSLRSSLRIRLPHLDKLLKLIGYLELIDLKETLRPLTYPPSLPRDRWAALLALSRMKDVEATQYILLRAQKQKVDDNVVYEIFPDLVYTRQREVLDYLITVLNSDEKNCHTADAENEQPVLCGYRVMEQLAPVIIDYPLTLDKSGDIQTTDYAQALTDVRLWFKQKGSTYQISNDKF